MEQKFVFLVEKEEMWAKMLQEVLEDNHIPCVSMPVYGIGYSVKTGKAERLKLLVPAPWKERAEALLQAIFPSDYEADLSEEI